MPDATPAKPLLVLPSGSVMATGKDKISLQSGAILYIKGLCNTAANNFFFN
jgi:hypothetical protein